MNITSLDAKERLKVFLSSLIDNLDGIAKNVDSEKIQQKSMEFAKKTVERLLDTEFKEDELLEKSIRLPGLFYMFNYLAETGHFYDAFPLCFIIDMDSKGFLGFNFHYVNPKYRPQVIYKLIAKYADRFMDDTCISPMSYSTFKGLMGAELMSYCKNAFKRYNRSQFKKMNRINVLRVSNIDMLDAITVVPSQWVSVTEREIQRRNKYKS